MVLPATVAGIGFAATLVLGILQLARSRRTDSLISLALVVIPLVLLLAVLPTRTQGLMAPMLVGSFVVLAAALAAVSLLTYVSAKKSRQQGPE